MTPLEAQINPAAAAEERRKQSVVDTFPSDMSGIESAREKLAEEQRKLEAISAARSQLASQWRSMIAAASEVGRRLSEMQRIIQRVRNSLAEARNLMVERGGETGGGAYNFDPGGVAVRIAGDEASIPELERAAAEIAKNHEAQVAALRAFGTKHEVPAQAWPAWLKPETFEDSSRAVKKPNKA